MMRSLMSRLLNPLLGSAPLGCPYRGLHTSAAIPAI